MFGGDSLSNFMGSLMPRRKTLKYADNVIPLDRLGGPAASGAAAAQVLSPRAMGAGRLGISPTFFRGSSQRADPSHFKSMPQSPRKSQLKWQHGSHHASMSKDRLALGCSSALGEDEYAAAVGPLLPLKGVSEFSLTILRSEGNQGSMMLLGVAEEGNFDKPTGWGRVWGLGPWNGRLLGFPRADSRDTRRAGEIRGDALMRGDMRGASAGASVRVRVDMDARRLYFQISSATAAKKREPSSYTAAAASFTEGSGSRDDSAVLTSADWVLARNGGEPIVLPERGVRPFARCARAEDAISLGASMQHKEAPAALSAPAAPAPASHVAAEPPPREQPHGKKEEAPPRIPDGASRREAELLTLVSSLQRELESARAQLERERQLRRQAEMFAQAAQQRADESTRKEQRQSYARAEHDRGYGQNARVSVASETPSAKEIEATLLTEVLHRDAKSLGAPPASSLRTSQSDYAIDVGRYSSRWGVQASAHQRESQSGVEREFSRHSKLLSSAY
jgi:hypothetical protein